MTVSDSSMSRSALCILERRRKNETVTIIGSTVVLVFLRRVFFPVVGFGWSKKNYVRIVSIMARPQKS